MKIACYLLFLYFYTASSNVPARPPRHVVDTPPKTREQPSLPKTSSGVTSVQYIGSGYGNPFPDNNRYLRRCRLRERWHLGTHKNPISTRQICGVCMHWEAFHCQIDCACGKWIRIGPRTNHQGSISKKNVVKSKVDTKPKDVPVDANWELEMSNVCWKYFENPGKFHPSYQQIVARKVICEHRCSHCNELCRCRIFSPVTSGQESTQKNELVCAHKIETTLSDSHFCHWTCNSCIEKCSCPDEQIVRHVPEHGDYQFLDIDGSKWVVTKSGIFDTANWEE